MVKKVFKIFHKEIKGLHEAAYLLAFFALLSQIIALARDRLLAYYFGAGDSLDFYYAAFELPDFIFITVASTVSISVLVPFLIEKLENSKNEGKKFIDNIFSFFFILIVGISVIAYFLMPYLATAIFPKLAKASSNPDFIPMTRILLLSPILLGISNFFASITQVYRRFLIYAISPLLYNVGIIIGIIFFYPIFGLKGLVFGVVLGAIFHFSIQIPFVLKQGLIPRFSFKIDFANIGKVVFLSIPRTVTLGISQIALIFLVSFASRMSEGSVSIFNFSMNLQTVPLSIIGVSYSIAAFPTLSRLFSSGQKDKFLEQIIISSRHIIFWSIPISVLFIILRAQIVRTILGAGKFSWDDTRLTAASLALFTISIIAQSMLLLLTRGYYAMGNTKKPLYAGLFSGVMIILFSYFFIKTFNYFPPFRYFIESLLRVDDIPGTSELMLPLGYSLALTLNCAILLINLHKDFPGYIKSIKPALFQSFSASIIMGFVSYLCLNVLDKVFNMNKLWGIFLQGLVSGLIGLVALVLILKLLKNREINEVWGTLHKKIWKAQPIAPDVSRL